jgi:hypothetical protein
MNFIHPNLKEIYKTETKDNLPIGHQNAYTAHLKKFYEPYCQINVKEHKCPKNEYSNILLDPERYNNSLHWAVQERDLKFSYGTEGDIGKMFGYRLSLKEAGVEFTKPNNKVENPDINENFNDNIKRSYAVPSEYATDYLVSQKTQVNSSTF